MDVIGMGARMVGRMSRMSPAGILFVGGAAVLAFPAVRHGLRSAAVVTTRGVLAVTDTLQSTAAMMREGMEDIVAEARAASEEQRTLMGTARTHGRRMAINAAAGALAVREGLRNIVEEAKETRTAASPEESPATMLTVTYPEMDAAEEPGDNNEPSSPRRRRSRSPEL
jgi:hypothetical protein